MRVDDNSGLNGVHVFGPADRRPNVDFDRTPCEADDSKRTSTHHECRYMDRRFVDHVLSAEIVTRAEMQRLILQARKNKSGLVSELLTESTVDETQVAEAVSSYYERPLVVPDQFTVDPTAIQLLSAEMARDNVVLPFLLEQGGDQVSVAIIDPIGAGDVIEMLREATGNEPKVWIARQTWLASQIAHHYFGEDLPGLEDFPTFTAPDPSATPTVRAPVADGDVTRVGPLAEPEVKEERPATNPKGKALGRIKPTKVRADQVNKPPDDKAELAQALEEFDQFLDNSSNFLGGGPNVGDDDVDPFSLDDGEFGGFDLFGQEVGLDESTSVEDKVSRQEDTIRQLVAEVKRQREVIQAMASILEEKGILRKRDLKKRARGK